MRAHAADGKKRIPIFNTSKVPADAIAATLRKGQLISLESTTYPGTTEEILLDDFARRVLAVGKDYFLVFLPEREDPGNPEIFDAHDSESRGRT